MLSPVTADAEPSVPFLFAAFRSQLCRPDHLTHMQGQNDPSAPERRTSSVIPPLWRKVRGPPRQPGGERLPQMQGVGYVETPY